MTTTLTETEQAKIEDAAFALRLALCTDKRWIARALRRLPADRRKAADVFFGLSAASLDYVLGKVKNAVQDAVEEALADLAEARKVRAGGG